LYPERYRLPAVARYVLELLERRRPALPAWDAHTDASIRASMESEARRALASAGEQFAEVADDPAYWKRIEQGVMDLVLPRYFREAEAQSQLEAKRFGLWRGGDFLSRVAYAGGGLLLAGFLWRARLPADLELLPVLVFIFGPVLPDFQIAFFKRRYRKQLETLVNDMAKEESQRQAYQPLGVGSISEPMVDPEHRAEQDKERA
jgi:hypothetical protein